MEFATKNKGLILIMIIMLTMINQSVAKWRYTKRQSYQGGNIFALTKHNIVCPNKNALQQFQAQIKGGQYWFKYICYGACAGLKRGKKSYNAHTKINDTDVNKNRSLHYLDRHNVQCRNGYTLQRVQLATGSKLIKEKNTQVPHLEKKIQYQFTCIETGCSKRVSYKSPTQNMGANETKNLPKLVVKIPKSHQVLTGFKFQRTAGNSFHYITNYCVLDHRRKPKPKRLSKPRISGPKKAAPKVPKLPTKPKELPPVVAPLTPAADLAKSVGDKFCAANCVPNPLNRQRLCQVGAGRFRCKRCTISPKVNSPEKRMICEALCNGIMPANPCTFFGWVNNAVKDIDGSVMRKYKMSLIRRK